MGGVADVEGGGEGAAEAGGDEGADTVHEKRGCGGEVISGDFDGLEDHERGDGVEDGEREDDGEVAPPLALSQQSEDVDGVWQE